MIKEVKAFISIIIPVYNTEKYLKRCLDSIVNQTFKDIEIIIVNDCSLGNCKEIVESYDDNRIIYIEHEYNKGLLLARKTGNLNSNGKYITYVDSDDCLNLNAIEEINKKYKERETDIIYFLAKAFSNENKGKDINKKIRDIQWRLSARYHIDENYLLSSLVDEKIIHNMWGKAYKRDLINKVTQYIPDIKLINAEDLLQSLIIFYFAKSYSFLDEELYYYYIDIGESNRNTNDLSLDRYSYLCENSSRACHYFLEFLKTQNMENLYGIYYYKSYFNQYRYLKEKIIDNNNKEKFLNILESFFDRKIILEYLKLQEYENLKIKRNIQFIEKLIPYFFSIIMYDYNVTIKILGIKIILKTKYYYNEPLIFSLNSLLKNIFSINTNDKNNKFIKILGIKIKL